MYYRLTQDWGGLPEGACIVEAKHKSIYYLDKALWEVIQDFEIKDMIEHTDEIFCIENGIDKLLFYTPKELERFLTKKLENAIT